MKIVVTVPPDSVPLAEGFDVPLVLRDCPWSPRCLGAHARTRGVYVIHHAGSIKYVGKTDGPTMSFGQRLRREFTEGGSQGKHIYADLMGLVQPPSIKVYLFPEESVRSLVACDVALDDVQRIAILETILIQVYRPEFQTTWRRARRPSVRSADRL
jgi:hypothetical protein